MPSLYRAFSGHIHCGYAVWICPPTGVAFAVLDDVVGFGFSFFIVVLPQITLFIHDL